jgi:hypothetical protein
LEQSNAGSKRSLLEKAPRADVLSACPRCFAITRVHLDVSPISSPLVIVDRNQERESFWPQLNG